jgi:hypothetical protein
MTASDSSLPVHPLLRELGFPLPLIPETCWTWAPIDSPKHPLCQLFLSESGDLYLEIEDQGLLARYGFDATGELVSLYHAGHFKGVLFAQLKASILNDARKKLGLPYP